jgi:hypothetical protein
MGTINEEKPALWTKRKEGLPSKEIPTRNTVTGGCKLRCTAKWPNCNQQLLRFQGRAETNQLLDTCLR